VSERLRCATLVARAKKRQLRVRSFVCSFVRWSLVVVVVHCVGLFTVSPCRGLACCSTLRACFFLSLSLVVVSAVVAVDCLSACGVRSFVHSFVVFVVFVFGVLLSACVGSPHLFARRPFAFVFGSLLLATADLRVGVGLCRLCKSVCACILE